MSLMPFARCRALLRLLLASNNLSDMREHVADFDYDGGPTP